MDHPLRILQRLGQSPWLDTIHRELLTRGILARMVRAGEVTGLTSNPTIFEQAISRGVAYDAALADLVASGRKTEQIVDALIVADIRAAADILLPVFRTTGRADGYVSVEVAPTLAHDTAATVREARRLWRAVNRPNLMVKIPATPAGLPAITECLAAGINVNVTLIFSLERYASVIDAYLAGLERRQELGLELDRVTSVASFFVSRLDTVVDAMLAERLASASPAHRDRLAALQGQAAIALARSAYQTFRTAFARERFLRLTRDGARVQRPLWASTSTKNPAYPDTYYVEALVGPDTVNTMPPHTLAAYRDHGRPERRLDRDVERSREVLRELESLGIDLRAVTARLEEEGVAAFVRSWQALLRTVDLRREALRERARVHLTPGTTAGALLRAPAARGKAPALPRPPEPAADLDRLVAFVQCLRGEVRQAGISTVVVCGDPARLLPARAVCTAFGRVRDGCEVVVCDRRPPAPRHRVDPARTLWLLVGAEAETTRYVELLGTLWPLAERALGAAAPTRVLALAAKGSGLDALARERGLRVVLDLEAHDLRSVACAPPTLLPLGLLGHDVARFADRARRFAALCGADVPPAYDPAQTLAGMLHSFARGGRRILTLVVPPRLSAFAEWLAYLIALRGSGGARPLVPVVGETLGGAGKNASDRLFVRFQLGGGTDRTVSERRRHGHPLLTLRLADVYDLAAEAVRWPVALDAFSRLGEARAAKRPRTHSEPPLPLRPDAADCRSRLRSHLAKARGWRWVLLAAPWTHSARFATLLPSLGDAIRRYTGTTAVTAAGVAPLETYAPLMSRADSGIVPLVLTASPHPAASRSPADHHDAAHLRSLAVRCVEAGVPWLEIDLAPDPYSAMQVLLREVERLARGTPGSRRARRPRVEAVPRKAARR